ncbi:glycolate utilization protein [Methylobacterium indicum]|uniref:Glycolate utilization protein n=1 Tax=Methylobacterium indicum TaxID=1775910 RepID=A0A0J6RQJ9_9HYPH|nr:heme-binding protein [Methylobacterium indicum]KMO22231.1 glycolate utilization protein [Methylobacterium indicum]KMO23673.1 glycolate utilization protein [Methylobacterium indicum]KTS13281.1 glycolate utilization protein [Methylobacterium indicum]KTS42623.1 glycolate utilization protein [Methylobacterium indicum]KTS47631.1 glycolate utilization protein [Methylobacterium indicum]
MHVTIEQAETAIRAAREKAVELGTQMCIAVVDSGGNLKAFHRMDGAWVGSIDIAHKKARTAVFFGMKTGAIGGLSQPGGPLYGIEHSNDGLITFPGGIPIVDETGEMSGAIGVSGSSVENDDAVALAGARAIGDTELPAHPWRT